MRRRLSALSQHLRSAVVCAAKQSVVVAAAQILTDHDVAENLQKILDSLATAAESGCEIVLFHEGALTGYPDAEACALLDFAAVTAAEDKVVARAAELRIAVLLGSTSQSAAGDIFNDVLIVGVYCVLLSLCLSVFSLNTLRCLVDRRRDRLRPRPIRQDLARWRATFHGW